MGTKDGASVFLEDMVSAHGEFRDGDPDAQGNLAIARAEMRDRHHDVVLA